MTGKLIKAKAYMKKKKIFFFFWEILEIQHPIDNPHQNGRAERLNQTLNNCAKIFFF